LSDRAPAIVWFRDDLRLTDNPALAAAAASGRPVLPVYLLDDGRTNGVRPPGGAGRWWLHHALASLGHDLVAKGAPLVLRRGDPADLLPRLVRDSGAGAVYWNRRYDAASVALDTALKSRLAADGVEVASFNAALLHEPWTCRTGSGGPFQVFTPFWRHCRAKPEPPRPAPAPDCLRAAAATPPSDDLDDWRLLPTTPDWAAGLRETWVPSEAEAQRRLDAFLDERLAGYVTDRDRPARSATSALSPYLRWGQIGPRQIWHAVERRRAGEPAFPADAADTFLKELGWREFSYHLLHHFPEMARHPLRQDFGRFPWRSDDAALRAWRQGRTGYPVVDAGMRQLWHTGWMHNRVRMIAASFLVKHLLLPWQEGEAWFWDTLVDADPANNPASWQWVAGSGADAAPFFRIFNPLLQGAKFDAEGDYVRRWVPELAAIPAEHIHTPWKAPPAVLARAGVVVGESYPTPIVDHAAARERALEAFRRLRA
jgi:deoxyribodipyrimidine photo-lyase